MGRIITDAWLRLWKKDTQKNDKIEKDRGMLAQLWPGAVAAFGKAKAG